MMKLRDKLPTWLTRHAWLYHYEVVVRRQGRDQLVARVPTEARAAGMAVSLRYAAELSSTSVHWRRVPGIHPVNAAKLVALLLLATLLLPWFWPRAVLGLLLIALLGGLLSSGTKWRNGGEDDR
jgi:hypothetical protein